jgi:hypothetical protein
VRKELNGNGGNVAAATLVGKRIAEKAKAAGVETVAFDRAASATTAASRRWPTPRAKPASSSKRERYVMAKMQAKSNRTNATTACAKR